MGDILGPHVSNMAKYCRKCSLPAKRKNELVIYRQIAKMT
jgi:hypothetical protein